MARILVVHLGTNHRFLDPSVLCLGDELGSSSPYSLQITCICPSVSLCPIQNLLYVYPVYYLYDPGVYHIFFSSSFRSRKLALNMDFVYHVCILVLYQVVYIIQNAKKMLEYIKQEISDLCSDALLKCMDYNYREFILVEGVGTSHQ